MISRFIIASLRIYQFSLSPFLGQACRFYPTCSTYAIGVLEKYGFWHGSYLTIRRLSRCHPWHPGGFDPIP